MSWTTPQFSVKRNQTNQFILQVNELETKKWLEEVFNTTLNDYPDCLRDGVILSQLVNKIKPGSMKELAPATSPFKMGENIQNLLKTLHAWKIPNIFAPDDLISKKNLGNVYACLRSISDFAETAGFKQILRPLDESGIDNLLPTSEKASSLRMSGRQRLSLRKSSPVDSADTAASSSPSQLSPRKQSPRGSNPGSPRSKQDSPRSQLESPRARSISLQSSTSGSPPTTPQWDDRNELNSSTDSAESLNSSRNRSQSSLNISREVAVSNLAASAYDVLNTTLPNVIERTGLLSVLDKTKDLTEKDHRGKLYAEILTTEHSYVRSLEIMLQLYLLPIQRMAKMGVDKKVTQESVQQIYADVDKIYKVNLKLYEEVDARLQSCQDVDNLLLAGVFSNLSDELKCYSQYSINYEKALKLLLHCRENAHFSDLLKTQREKYQILDLQDYLIVPVQRLPRYMLLLTGILKATKPTHPDYNNLETALDKIKEVTDFVNDSIKSNEKLREFMEAASKGKLKHLMNINPDRKFIFMDTLGVVKLTTKGGSKKLSEPESQPFYLFDDILACSHEITKKPSKENEHEYSIKLKYTWINEGRVLIGDDGTKTTYTEIISPMKSWLIVIKSDNQKHFLNHIKKAVAALLPNNDIYASREFTHDISQGIYAGEWNFGRMHGKGTYMFNADSRKYEGYWDSNLKAGFGSVIYYPVDKSSSSNVKKASKYETAWTFEDDYPIDLPPEEEGISYVQVDLTPRDWRRIQAGAQFVTFKKGQVIIPEDSVNKNLYQIKDGVVRVEKLIDGKPKQLATMTSPQMFGEMSILGSARTNVAIVVDSDSVELFVIELDLVFNLFKSSSGLSKRFWRGMALKLADRLSKLHTPNQAPKPAASGSNTSSPSSSANSTPTSTPRTGTASSASAPDVGLSKDEEYQQRFGLPPTEVILKEYAATMEGVLSQYGSLYVSEHFFCFYSKIFGYEAKKVIPLENVTEITTKGNDKIVLKQDKKKITFKFDEKLEEAMKIMSPLLKKESITKRASVRTLDIPQFQSPENAKDAMQLSPDDWVLLLRSAKLVSYTKNQVVFNQGDVHNRIFQIARGSCRIEKQQPDGKPLVLGRMANNEPFGEISFLQGGPATASIIADEDKVDIYVFEGYYINILYAKDPALAGRFFYYLSTLLSSRFEQREKGIRK